MKKISLFIALLVILLLLVWGFKTRSVNKNQDARKIKITTSFYPLYFLAAKIGGEKVNVINITPTGAEPHDYEPSTSDTLNIEESKILILNGGGLEPWGEKLNDIVGSSKVNVIKVGDGLATKTVIENGQSIQDPHIWLDPVLFKKEAAEVLTGLVKVDPGNENYYAKNNNDLNRSLDLLDSEFKNGLRNCKQTDIVTSHAAFGYLASRYKLNQVAITGISPDTEASPKKISEIADLVKNKRINYIFFENLVSPRLAETLANETGAKTLSFNPLEGLTKDQALNGEDYFSLQKNNLQSLKMALDCK